MTIKALTFDVFGTVVDWRTAVIAEVEALGRARGVAVDGAAFTDRWKACYRPAMDRVNAGDMPWTNVDEIYRGELETLLPEFGLGAADAAERERLTTAWCRPVAWSDSVAGIARLKSKYLLSTLSNGNFAWLCAIARHCALPFDCVITAENARAYKPDARVYRTALDLLGLAPGEAMMVACHNYDLAAAQALGMKTAFLPRKEHGPDQTVDQAPDGDWDIVASDLRDLADRLGC